MEKKHIRRRRNNNNNNNNSNKDPINNHRGAQLPFGPGYTGLALAIFDGDMEKVRMLSQRPASK
jgi:hypothetical protein